MAENEPTHLGPPDDDATLTAPEGAQADPDAPAQVGPYRPLSRLGEGGMGEVWLAEQKEPLERTVALKLVKLGMDTRQFVARFEAERQALALMEHPCIARVIDGGATETGRPYFVMEYVEGVPIHQYCNRRRLSVRARLELFIQVCRGVQHAHQKGVIHRDLKPSNILVADVDGKPVPKIIDFGVAKATTQALTEKTVHTVLGGWIGTPTYMSPEQAEITDDIDTRTDVYSLGATLYEILTGERLFAKSPRETGYDEMRRLIREVEPPRPSTRVSSADRSAAEIARSRATEPRLLVRELRGDLDWIVMKALEKDRERRYGSPLELAQDLERHLNHQPILARPPSTAYRARKFVRRHKVGVAAGAAVLVGMAAAVVGTSVGLVRARAAESVAAARRDQAEDLIAFMVGDLRDKLKAVGRLEILEDVGDKALGYFASVDAGELTGSELVRRSRALIQIGEVRMAQGDLQAARETFEESLTLGRALGERGVDDETAAELLFESGEALNRIGEVWLAEGSLEEAKGVAQEARSIAEVLVARDPDRTEWINLLGASSFWLGNVAYLRGNSEEALSHMVRYLEAAERLVELEPASPDWRLELAYAHSSLGSVHEARGELDRALAEFDTMRVITEKLLEEDPQNTDRLLDLAINHNSMGSALAKSGDLEAAIEHYRADLAIKQELVARDPSNTAWQDLLATAHNYLAKALSLRGDGAATLEHLRSQLSLTRQLVDKDPANADWRRDLASSHRALGLALLSADPARALSHLETARSIMTDLVSSDPTNLDWRRQLAMAQESLGRGLFAAGRASEAGKAAVDALDALAPVGEDRASAIVRANALLLAGMVESGSDRPDAARAAWEGALESLAPHASGAEDPQLLEPLARALLLLGRDREAAPVVERLDRQGLLSSELEELAALAGRS